MTNSNPACIRTPQFVKAWTGNICEFPLCPYVCGIVIFLILLFPACQRVDTSKPVHHVHFAADVGWKPIGYCGFFTEDFLFVAKTSRTADATSIFLQMVQNGPNAETRIYGLIGMKMVSPEKFSLLVKMYEINSPKTILLKKTLVLFGPGGCCMSYEPFQFVVLELEKVSQTELRALGDKAIAADLKQREYDRNASK